MEIDVKKSILALDTELAKLTKEIYTLYTCGGASLIFLGYDSRRTSDVDIICEQLDDVLVEASKIVSKKLNIPIEWINNKVTPLGDRLGIRWKSKCIILYKGKNLILKSISRQDLISSKLHAAIDRTRKDFDDLLWLKPSLTEIENAKKYVLKQSKIETYEIFVNAYVKELKNALGL